MTGYITSYIVNFTPDGCKVEKEKNVTYQIYYRFGDKIISMIHLLVQALVDNMKYSAEKK